jgi:hypothetical protein
MAGGVRELGVSNPFSTEVIGVKVLQKTLNARQFFVAKRDACIS